MLWLYELPLLWLAVLVVGVFLAFGLGGLALTRSWVSRHRGSYNELANDYIAAVGVFYAVLVGLIAVATWGNYTGVDAIVSNEASAVADLYRDADAYPADRSEAVHATLRWYVHTVIEKEWPQQKKGVRPTVHAAARLLQSVTAFEPVTPGQQVLQAECLHKVNEILTYRRQRLQAVDISLPGLMWLLVLVGAAITLGMTFFFWVEDWRFHVLFTAALTVMIALVILLILSLERPLVGAIVVDTSDFQEVLTDVMGEPGQ